MGYVIVPTGVNLRILQLQYGCQPKNRGVFTPQIIHLFIGFSSILGKTPYFWKHPYPLPIFFDGLHRTRHAGRHKDGGIFSIKFSSLKAVSKRIRSKRSAGKKCMTLPKTSIFAPENGWLGKHPASFWGILAHSQWRLLLVSGRIHVALFHLWRTKTRSHASGTAMPAPICHHQFFHNQLNVKITFKKKWISHPKNPPKKHKQQLLTALNAVERRKNGVLFTAWTAFLRLMLGWVGVFPRLSRSPRTSLYRWRSLPNLANSWRPIPGFPWVDTWRIIPVSK